jgi:transposase
VATTGSRDLNRSYDDQSREGRRIVILFSLMGADDSLPDDVIALKAMLRA